MKESGVEWFGKIPNHWELHRLGRISEKITDIDHKMPAAQEEGIPFISAKDLMDDGSINFGPNVKKISQEDYENLSRKIVPKKNDIIYSRIGTVGKARLVQSDVKFLASYSCCFIRLNQDLALPKYITFLLDNEITLIDAKLKSTGIGQPDLALKEINHFKIPLPPMDEQEEISTYLEKQIFCYNQLRDRLAESIDKLVEYRSSLISAAVTGKIDVRSL